MSKENRPNLNAVGLSVDITRSIEKYIRGKAAYDSNASKVFELTENSILDFVEEINLLLDEEFGTNQSE